MSVRLNYLSRWMSHVSQLLGEFVGCEKVDSGLVVAVRDDYCE